MRTREVGAGDGSVIRGCLAAQICLMAVLVTAQQLRFHAVSSGVVRGVQGAAILGMLVPVGFMARRRFRGRRQVR